MANIKVKSDTWEALSVTTGTVQNVSPNYSIEVSEVNDDCSGQVLVPYESMSFDSIQLYVRAVDGTEGEAEVRVSPFVDTVGSSSGSGGGSSATPYVLPTASASTKGGVMVGTGLTINNAVLAADTGTSAGKLVKVESDGKIDSSILPAIAIGNTFVENSEAGMLALSATVGDICVRNDEHKSYILQSEPATSTANWILLQTPASDVTSVNGQTGAVTVTVPTKTSDLTNDSGYITSIPTATTTTKGMVSIGDGLTIDSNGKLSATGGGSGGGSYTLPTASSTTLGGIKVGQNLEVDANGILKSKHETITMGTDTTSTATVASGGSFTAIDAITKDTHGHVTAVNTKTVTIPTIPVQATSTSAGIMKLYAAAGEGTDGAMTQKAVKDALADKLDSADYKLTDLIDDTTASTSTVYSASKVDTKLGGYLPLSGGALTGNSISRNINNSSIDIFGGTSGSDGAFLEVVGGGNSSSYGGTFSLVAQKDTSKVSLWGKPDGTLTWGSKNVLVSDGILVGSAAIKRASDTGYLELYGASGYQKGAMISLSGKDRSGLSGEFYIRADNGTTSKELKGKPDGTLTWGNKAVAVAGDYLPIGGGTMTGTDIKRDVDSSVLVLCGGTNYGNGAQLNLNGKDNTGGAGEFYLTAYSSAGRYTLNGKPDGALTWEGKDISNTYSTTEKAIGTWIDGKTIYRRVYTFSEVTLAADTWKQLTGVSSTGITQVISAWVFRAGDKSSIPVACNVAGQYIGVCSFGDFNVTKLCLEYTKS